MQATAAVVGGGIAGLATGAALKRAGYRVTLFEQAPAIEPIGAALSIWGNAMAGLDWIGCGDAVRAGAARVDRIVLLSGEGKPLFGPAEIADTDSWLPMRSHLQAVLADALGRDSIRLGTAIDDIREAAASRVELASGGEVLESADLCIVADGIWSATATRLLGNAPEFRGYAGALGVAQAAGGEWPAATGGEIWHGRERFGLFDAGEGRRYWFYMAPSATAQDAQRFDLDAISRRTAGWRDEVRATLAASDPASVIPVAIHARPVPRRLGQGRIICIGDAAHAMEPNQGQGACQGIEDAWALGVLAERLPAEAILPEFERLRLPRLKPVMRDSMLVGRAAHSPHGWERAMVRTLFGAVPQALDQWQIRRRLCPPVYR